MKPPRTSQARHKWGEPAQRAALGSLHLGLFIMLLSVCFLAPLASGLSDPALFSPAADAAMDVETPGSEPVSEPVEPVDTLDG